VQAQDRLASTHVRLVDDDLPVEATGTEQRLVEDLRTVRGGHDDHALRGVEPVHLRQELVERLLTLVVPADEAGAARPRFADGVELVDEHDAGRLVLGLLEEVADP